MSEILGTIKGLIAGFQYNKVYVDNVVFRLHYKVTALLLLLFGILVTERQYIGDPIDCITDAKAEKVIDQFCWIHGTYTQLAFTKDKNIPGYAQLPTVEDDVAFVQKHPALTSGRPAPHIEREFFNYKAGDVEDRVFHKYYQWVWCLLFFQALLFYFPHWLWKAWEGGRMKTFVAGLKSHTLSDDDKRKQQEAVCDYFCNQAKGQWSMFCWTPKGQHTVYATKYFFCELLNFINICCQLYYLDWFFYHGFRDYGWKLWDITDARPYARSDYMTKIFPIITMCELPVIGYAGVITNHQALCVLSINVLNGKIYIFLMAWFLMVLVVTAFGICYRIITLFPHVSIRKWFLLRLNHSMSDKTVDTLCRQVDFGDWYFLYLLGKNMNPIYYAELITALANRFEEQAELRENGPTWGDNYSIRKELFENPFTGV